MEVLFEVCAGMDVHRDTVVVSIRKREGGREQVETRTFETFHDQIVEMVRWLDEHAVKVVGLESTGVYWKPIVRELQRRSAGGLIWLVNPAEVKKVPGRKTDVNDSQWLSKLVMHGLVSPSYLPPAQQQEMRQLTRFRMRLVATKTACKNRILKELETAGIKLAAVCSDVFGKSGRAMLQALLDGRQTPAEMAQLARGVLQLKRATLERALDGSFGSATHFILRQLLGQLEHVERDIVELDAQIEAHLERFSTEIELLTTVPGLNRVAIAAILAEIGGDMSVFGSADKLTAWGGLCPGSNESAGKTKATASRKGDKYLRTMLVQAAWTAVRAKGSHWKQTFRRLTVPLGPKKAIVAIARRMLVAIFYILRDSVPYQPPSPQPPSPAARERAIHRHIAQLAALGFEVTLKPNAQVPEPTGPEPLAPPGTTFS